MSARTCDIAACVAGYSRRLHAAIGTGHQVASPLGAWLLLALAGPASSGPDRDELADVLGCDVEAAARAAEDLLANPHPVVASAAAVWTGDGGDLSDHFRQWRLGLPDAVEFGALPDQAGADQWAREHTFGLIGKFPVQITLDVYLVLATALATKVSWAVPFDLAPAVELGPARPWSQELSRVLRVPDPEHPHGHRQFIAATSEAGDVAVHVAEARSGLSVYSVAAAPDVPASAVLAAAHQIGCSDATGGAVRQRDLGELELGAGPAWMLREETPARGSRDICTAVLPAWSATSDHNLARAGLGFDLAKDALVGPADPWQARQAAMARYTRVGFEAAAVTAVAVALAMMRPPDSRRIADLQFGHPYAAVAVAIDSGSAWHGVPVFSAWVAEPQNAEE